MSSQSVPRRYFIRKWTYSKRLALFVKFLKKFILNELFSSTSIGGKFITMVFEKRFIQFLVVILAAFCFSLGSSDPCSNANTTMCDQYATCTATGPDSYTCACRDGYIGNGTYCYVNMNALDPGRCQELIEYQCLDGTCIHVSQLRNGVSDCQEDEDEACHPESNRIRCDYLCVDQDEVEDMCEQKIHKLYCMYFNKTDYFMCYDQKICIPKSWQNDGQCSCNDCSDEIPTTSTSTTTTTTPPPTSSPPPPPPPPPTSPPSTTPPVTSPPPPPPPPSSTTTSPPPTTTTVSTSTTTTTPPTTTTTTTTSPPPTTTTTSTSTTTTTPPTTTTSPPTTTTSTSTSTSTSTTTTSTPPPTTTSTTTPPTTTTTLPPPPPPTPPPTTTSTTTPAPTLPPPTTTTTPPPPIPTTTPTKPPPPPPPPPSTTTTELVKRTPAAPTQPPPPPTTQPPSAPPPTPSAADEALTKCWNEKSTNGHARMESGKSAVCPCDGYMMPNQTKHCTTSNVIVLQLTSNAVCNSNLEFAKFNSTLTNPNSAQFVQMAEMVVTGLVDVIRANPGLSAMITQVCVARVPMRSGSVLTTVNIQTNGSTAGTVAQALNSALANNGGQVGQSGLMSPNDAIKDADECSIGGTECDAHAACSNTFGGYNCNCTNGYADISRNGQRTGSACSSSDTCQSNMYIGSTCVGIGWIIFFALLCAALLLLSLLLLCCLCCPSYRNRYFKNGSTIGSDRPIMILPRSDRETQTEDDPENGIYIHDSNYQTHVISMSPNQPPTMVNNHDEWETSANAGGAGAWHSASSRPPTAASRRSALRNGGGRNIATPHDIEITHGLMSNGHAAYPNHHDNVMSHDLNGGYAPLMNGMPPPPDLLDTSSLTSEIERRRKLKALNRKASRASAPLMHAGSEGAISQRRSSLKSASRPTGTSAMMMMEEESRRPRRSSEGDTEMRLTPPNSIPTSPRRGADYRRPRTGKAPPTWKVWKTKPGYFGHEHMIFDD